jgi:RAD51-like protein 2
MVPALGESWAHVCTNRVLLTWQGSVRTACLVKAAGNAPGACLFSVTADGIRRVRALRS